MWCVRWLHSLSPTLPSATRHGRRDAHDAIEQGDHDKVAGLLKDAKNSDLGVCLGHACRFGEPECVRLLLAAHANVNTYDIDGVTPLHEACAFDDHIDCVQLLLAARAAIDQPVNNGTTPLYAACKYGRSECTQLLITATIDQADKKGITPLYAACNQGECTQLTGDQNWWRALRQQA